MTHSLFWCCISDIFLHYIGSFPSLVRSALSTLAHHLTGNHARYPVFHISKMSTQRVFLHLFSTHTGEKLLFQIGPNSGQINPAFNLLTGTKITQSNVLLWPLSPI